MPLILDIFGVVMMQSGLNTQLLELCAAWRRDGERIFGASNMTALHNQEFGRQPGISDAFDAIYCSGVLGVAKPDPVFYTAVAQKIGAMPQDLLFFDDSGVNVEAAAACGWQAHVFTDARDLQATADGFFQAQRAAREPNEMFEAEADGFDAPAV